MAVYRMANLLLPFNTACAEKIHSPAGIFHRAVQGTLPGTCGALTCNIIYAIFVKHVTDFFWFSITLRSILAREREIQ